MQGVFVSTVLFRGSKWLRIKLYFVLYYTTHNKIFICPFAYYTTWNEKEILLKNTRQKLQGAVPILDPGVQCVENI